MSYDMIDRYLRNNLHDDDYAEYSAALDALAGVRQPLTDEQREAIWKAHVLPGFGKSQKFYGPVIYARAIEAAHGIGGLSPAFMQAQHDEAPRLDLGA